MRVPTLAPARIIAADQRSPQAMPQIRRQAAGPDAFGVGLGEGIEAASRTAFGVWRQEAERVNEARVLEADTAAAKHELETWTALESTRGAAAPEAFNRSLEAMQKRQSDIERGLANEAQRSAFRRASANRLQAFENRGSAHVVREARRADEQASEANLAIGLEQVAASRNDWQTAAQLTEDTISKRVAYLRRNGVEDAEIQRQVGVLRSTATRRVAEGLIADDNDLAAKRLVDQYGGYLTEEDRTALAGRLKLSSTKGEAMRLADKAFAEKMDATAGRTWLIEQAGDNPELRDMAIQRWENHRAAAERALIEDQHTAYAEAFKLLEDPTNDYATLPESLLMRLEQRPELKAQLMSFGRKQDRTVVQNDPELIVELERLAIDDPTKFATVDVRALAGRLTPAKLDEYAKAIGQAKAGGKGGKELRGIITREQAVKDSYLAAGIDEKDDPEDAAFFRQMLHERVMGLEKTTGKEATPDQISAEAKKLLVRVALDARSGRRPDTVEWRRAQALLADLDDDNRTALMAEAGGNIDRAVRMLMEQQREAEKQAAAASGRSDGTPPRPSSLLFGSTLGPR